MKFLKQSQINFRNVKDQSIAVVVDGSNDQGTLRDPRIVMAVTNSLQLPTGTTAQRPDEPIVLTNGIIRYNETTDEIEVRQGGVWKRIAYKESKTIELQSLGTGDGLPDGTGELQGEVYFGPLVYNDGVETDYPDQSEPDPTKPQNLLVFIENVPQLANTNYILERLEVGNPEGKTPGVYVKFNGAVPFGKPVNVLHGFDR